MKIKEMSPVVILVQCAKNVHFNSCRLVDSPVGLLDSALHFPCGQVKFFGGIFDSVNSNHISKYC